MDAQYQSASDAAQARVLADEEPMLQAALEQLAVIRWFRKMLVWTLFVVPGALVVIAIVLALLT